MRRVRSSKAQLLMLSLWALFSAALPQVSAVEPALTELPEPVRLAMDKHKLPVESLSVYVQDVSEKSPLLTINAQIPRNPASVMKLVTTLVGLHELGPAYRFFTDVYADSEPKDGRIEGNLYLRGSGDPFLVTESFWRLLKELRALGVQHIAGDVVVDSSFFDARPVYRGDFDGRPSRAYNVGPDATLVNFFATRFRFFPVADSDQIRIVVDPPLANLTIDNRIKVSSSRCSSKTRRIRSHLDGTSARPKVVFSGVFSSHCDHYELLRAVAEPIPYISGLFQAMWQEVGGSHSGKLRAGTKPAQAVRLQRLPSQPLAELIRYMNKFSNNVMTRNLLLAIGANAYGPPGTLDKGRRAIADWLALNDINAPELYVDNGAGLSRQSRVSALSLARMLIANWNSPYMPEFVSSLPLSAMDGTLRRRFRNSALEGKVHMKTGLLNGVRSIAGYLQTHSGRRIVLVSLQNHPGVQNQSGTEVQDALIEWAYHQW